MKKTHINSLRNLLSKYTKEEIVANIDKLNFDKADIELREQIFATNETAIEWFENFCAQYNLTIFDGRTNPKHYDRLTISEFGFGGGKDALETPYFMLWLNDRGPHVEIGSSLSDLWGWIGMSDLEAKMHKICEMQGINSSKIN